MKSFLIRKVNNSDFLRRFFLALQKTFTIRRYAVMTSDLASEYRFDGLFSDKPPFPLLNLRNAVFECRFWSGYSNSGRAKIIDVVANKEVSWEKFMKFDRSSGREAFNSGEKTVASVFSFRKKREDQFDYVYWKKKKSLT